jgi:hypothetical protein
MSKLILLLFLFGYEVRQNTVESLLIKTEDHISGVTCYRLKANDSNTLSCVKIKEVSK